MSNYTSKLSSISEKIRKLEEDHSKLVDGRKKEIGSWAEKFGLLEVSDQLITGLFSELQSALNNKSDQLKAWEKKGEAFLKAKRNNKEAQEVIS